MLRAIIVEDEYHSCETLKSLIREYSLNILVVDTADDVGSGIEIIKKHRPDIAFLDIELKSGTSFEILEKVGHLDFEVIFTTAFEHYALKAIKFSAIDYLLKPIDIDEFREAIRKVSYKQDAFSENEKLITLLNNINQQNYHQQTIILSTAEGYEFIPIKDILYCKADGSYTQFHLKNKKKIIVSRHLKEYENLLMEHAFFRIHQSYLVNLAEIEKYVKAEGGSIIMRNGDELLISPKKKSEFMEIMRNSH